MIEIENYTATTVRKNGPPTATDTEGPAGKDEEGNDIGYPLPECIYCFDYLNSDLYFLRSNDGVTADWKQVTLT